jgi:hypothetical protein
MSRKVIFSLATAATLAVASLASGAAEARGFGGGGGGHFGGGHFAGGRIGGGRVGGNHFAARGNGPLHPIMNPGRGGHGHPGHFGNHWAGHHHGHWVFRDGIWIDVGGYDGVGEVDVAPAPVAVGPGPCTCLTKNYTPDGLVVFADVCTKEAASARVDGASSDATPVPPPAPSKASDATMVPAADGKLAEASQAPTSQNYAGRTYQDYLAANAQAANMSAPKN